MIGANLAHRLVASGYHVSLLIRPGANLVRLRTIEDQMQILCADVTDEAAVRSVVHQAKPEIVFHLVSTPFNPPTFSPESHFRVNVLGTLHMVEALLEYSDLRFVYTGSAAEYGAGTQLCEDSPLLPGTILGASKAATSILLQTYARLHQMNTVVLRLFTPYGPWEHAQRLIPHTILSALEGRDVTMSQGHQQRDYVYVDDLVDSLILAARQRIPSGSIFNIGSGVGIPIRQVVELILNLMGNPVIVLAGVLPLRSDEIMEMSGDITAARTVLGWQPRINLEEGIRKSIAWFSEHRELASQLS